MQGNRTPQEAHRNGPSGDLPLDSPTLAPRTGEQQAGRYVHE